MRTKIGFIDAYIDEAHANSYPGMIARSRYGSEFEVVRASETTPAPGKRTLDAWCRENGVRAAASPEEVVAECDAIFVLAPSSPECHEGLAWAALESGKPVFVDKPFCDTLAGARRMFELADRHHTPLTSFSALRYAPGLQRFLRERLNEERPRFVRVHGNGTVKGFRNYGIHMIEMLVMILGTGAEDAMQSFGAESCCDMMQVRYSDSRRGLITRTPSCPFEAAGCYESGREFRIGEFDGFYDHAIEAILEFFRTGENPVPRRETFEAIRLYETGLSALERPGKWCSATGNQKQLE